MKPFSRALSDYHSGVVDAAFTIRRDDGFVQQVPAAPFFEAETFPALEVRAMEECYGCVLDVGSAAGRHSLELIRRGYTVTSLDVLPEMEHIMKERGLPDVVIADILEFSGRRFDTILMLMNGIGMVGTVDGLAKYLRHAHTIVNPGGQIVCDSIDVGVTEDPQHIAYRERNMTSGRPAGQQRFVMDYSSEELSSFDWLHIDFASLSQVCEIAGWSAELLENNDNGQYVCKLTQKTNKFLLEGNRKIRNDCDAAKRTRLI